MTNNIMVPGIEAKRLAIEILRNGGVVIYPTETCYGFGVDVTNKKALERLYDLKGRSEEKKISAACSSLKMFKQYAKLNDKQDRRIKLLSKFLPGPLTIICNGHGLRIPRDDFVLSLIEEYGSPITSTSANPSGEAAPKEIKEIDESLLCEADLIINNGLLAGGFSTVFSLDEMRVKREGPITKVEIMDALRE